MYTRSIHIRSICSCSMHAENGAKPLASTMMAIKSDTFSFQFLCDAMTIFKMAEGSPHLAVLGVLTQSFGVMKFSAVYWKSNVSEFLPYFTQSTIYNITAYDLETQCADVLFWCNNTVLRQCNNRLIFIYENPCTWKTVFVFTRDQDPVSI